MHSLNENIRLLRKKKGFSQEKLARAINVSPNTISKWETGKSIPDASLLPVLAEALETTIQGLYGEEGSKDDGGFEHRAFLKRMIVSYALLLALYVFPLFVLFEARGIFTPVLLTVMLIIGLVLVALSVLFAYYAYSLFRLSTCEWFKERRFVYGHLSAYLLAFFIGIVFDSFFGGIFPYLKGALPRWAFFGYWSDAVYFNIFFLLLVLLVMGLRKAHRRLKVVCRFRALRNKATRRLLFMSNIFLIAVLLLAISNLYVYFMVTVYNARPWRIISNDMLLYLLFISVLLYTYVQYPVKSVPREQ